MRDRKTEREREREREREKEKEKEKERERERTRFISRNMLMDNQKTHSREKRVRKAAVPNSTRGMWGCQPCLTIIPRAPCMVVAA